jgi:5,6-dimethylbenzimidazole synthase
MESAYPVCFPEDQRRAVYDVIHARRDIRSQFTAEPIAPEVLWRVLDAAHHAGSVGFMQPWNFLVVSDRGRREQVHEIFVRENARAATRFEGERASLYRALKLEGILEAPINICVTCDHARHGPHVLGRNTMRDTDVYSTCCAIQNLWLAARAEGLGVGWVSILDPEAVKKVLGIPPEVDLIAYLCVGHVREFPATPDLARVGWQQRLPLSQLVYWNEWQTAFPLAESAAQPTEPKSETAAVSSTQSAPRNADQAKPEQAEAPAAGEAQRRIRRGLLIVNTGNGKGKTTASLGIVTRAWGRGMAIRVFQFIKHSTGNWGELRALKKMEIPVTTMGAGFTWLSKNLEKDAGLARACWQLAAEEIVNGSADIVLLDEFTYALHYGWIACEEVLKTLQSRPVHRHVIVTGRHAPEALLAAADLVTEMKKIKHPYDNNIGAQPGIEF